MKNTYRILSIVTILAISFVLGTKPVQALPWIIPWITPASPKTSAVKNTAPSASLSYTLSPRQFTVSAKGVKNVSYTITYQRTGSRQTEALSGGGRSSNGTYLKHIYAGSQSSRYFIPHNVLSGHFQFDAITTSGGNLTVSKDFVIRKGKLVYTN